jgi:hypothetical protein
MIIRTIFRVVPCLLFSFSRFVQADDAVDGDWKMAHVPLVTRWAKDVSPTHALPEYPRPQMVRSDWMNLNGLWDYALSDKEVAHPPTTYAGKILVPYPYESALSGIAGKSIPKQRLWYHRTFDVPPTWAGRKVLLHFGAVNWECTVLVNGKEVGSHRGGYTGFEFDVTDQLHPGENDLTVSSANPLLVDQPDAQPLGKQRDHSFVVFYSSTTGIWQTVWLEPVPVNHIVSLKITPDIDTNTLHLHVVTSAPAQVSATTGAGTYYAHTMRAQPDITTAYNVYTTIPDHLMLDLFWMPAVEPYAISDSFSTAGKINLNYQIQPFTYIDRNTALVCLMKPESSSRFRTVRYLTLSPPMLRPIHRAPATSDSTSTRLRPMGVYDRWRPASPSVTYSFGVGNLRHISHSL